MIFLNLCDCLNYDLYDFLIAMILEIIEKS
jgi:hypothetical protein